MHFFTDEDMRGDRSLAINFANSSAPQRGKEGAKVGKTGEWEQEKETASRRNEGEKEKERERRRGEQIEAAYLQSTCILLDAWLQLLIERSTDQSQDSRLAIVIKRAKIIKGVARAFHIYNLCDAWIMWVKGTDSDNTLVC